ncbi:hypothetical protein [Brevundimonas diminuta]|uniref:hypothetical protein n=1 Tax=Brevundimonas diminuta TaxID=293 RepID=UPI000627543F|nr:hypothetical protein [Brevundimonas diminuta]
MVKKLLAFLIFCMALALARTLLMVLAVVLLLALVHAFVTRPRETLVFLGTLMLSSLAVAQPLAFIIGAVGVIGLVVIGGGIKRKRRNPLPMTYPSESD